MPTWSSVNPVERNCLHSSLFWLNRIDQPGGPLWTCKKIIWECLLMPFSVLVAKVRHCVPTARFTSFWSLHVVYTPTEECDWEVLHVHDRWNYITCKFEHIQTVSVRYFFWICTYSHTVAAQTPCYRSLFYGTIFVNTLMKGLEILHCLNSHRLLNKDAAPCSSLKYHLILFCAHCFLCLIGIMGYGLH